MAPTKLDDIQSYTEQKILLPAPITPPEIRQQLPISLKQLKTALNSYKERYPDAKLLDSILEMEGYERVPPNETDIRLALDCALYEAAAIRMTVYAKTHFTPEELKELKLCLTHKPRPLTITTSMPTRSLPQQADIREELTKHQTGNCLPTEATDHHAVDLGQIANEEHERLLSQDFIISVDLQRKLGPQDAINVEVYGCWLSALETRLIKPLDDNQTKFLEVVAGKLEPENEIQASWMRFKKFRTQKTVCGRCAGKGFYFDEIGMPGSCPNCHRTRAERII